MKERKNHHHNEHHECCCCHCGKRCDCHEVYCDKCANHMNNKCVGGSLTIIVSVFVAIMVIVFGVFLYLGCSKEKCYMPRDAVYYMKDGEYYVRDHK